MSADIIPFPTPPSYLDYCPTPRLRKNARKMFKRFTEEMDMSEAEAERTTLRVVKRCAEYAARKRRGPPPAS